MKLLIFIFLMGSLNAIAGLERVLPNELIYSAEDLMGAFCDGELVHCSTKHLGKICSKTVNCNMTDKDFKEAYCIESESGCTFTIENLKTHQGTHYPPVKCIKTGSHEVACDGAQYFSKVIDEFSTPQHTKEHVVECESVVSSDTKDILKQPKAGSTTNNGGYT